MYARYPASGEGWGRQGGLVSLHFLFLFLRPPNPYILCIKLLSKYSGVQTLGFLLSAPACVSAKGWASVGGEVGLRAASPCLMVCRIVTEFVCPRECCIRRAHAGKKEENLLSRV